MLGDAGKLYMVTILRLPYTGENNVTDFLTSEQWFAMIKDKHLPVRPPIYVDHID